MKFNACGIIASSNVHTTINTILWILINTKRRNGIKNMQHPLRKNTDIYLVTK